MNHSNTRHLFCLVVLCAAGCGSDPSPGLDPDSGASDSAVTDVDAGTNPDAALADAGTLPDAALDDASTSDPDAGPPPDAGSPPACAVVRALTLPSDTATGILDGASENRSTTCTPGEGTPGAEHFYSLHVDAPTGVRIRATAPSPMVQLAVAIRTACDDALSEVACEITEMPLPFPPGPMPAPRVLVDQVLAPGDYFVLVDAIWPMTGAHYTLTLETYTPAAHGTCATAVPVTDGTTLPGESLGGAGPAVVDCGTSGGIDGPTLWYSITIPPRTRLTVTNSDGSISTAIVPSCASTTCVTTGVLGSAIDIYHDNTGAAAEPVIIAAGAAGPFSPPTFDLGFSLAALAVSSSCEAAEPIVSGEWVTGDAALGGSSTTCEGGPSLYYSITVPAEHVLHVSLLPDAALTSPTVTLLAGGCAARTCVGEVRVYPWAADYRNAAATPVDLIVAVTAPPYTTGAHPFSMTTTLEPFASNRTCATAATLTSGVLVAGDSMLGGTLLSCDGSGERIGGPLYYRATIEPGQTLRVSARGGSPVAAAMFTSCGAATCFARGVGDPTSFVRTNSGTVAEDVIIAVGTMATYAFVGAPVEVVANIGPTPTNMVCATATPVGDGTVLPAQNAASGVDDLSAVCDATASTGALYYSVAVPAGERLEIAARPAITWGVGSWTPVLRLLASCGATSCVDHAPVGPVFDSTAARLSHANDTAATENFVIAVSSRGPTPPGLFDLEVSIAPPPYRESPITASCDDMSGGTLIPMPTGSTFTTISAQLPLPFAFDYFGDAVTQFVLSHDGFLQLRTAAGDVITSDGDANHALPWGSSPRGLVGVLWDDLDVGATGAVRTLTTGIGPNRRLVVEWSGYQYVGDPLGASLRFQAKLFETTGVVEFHYCTLGTASPPHDRGGSATIGMQNLARTVAIQHSYDTPSVDTGSALRFTPSP